MTLKYAQRPSEDICFRDNFISNDYVTDNGGTIYNAPTISNGITTNGSTQYVDYGDVCNLGSDDFSFSFKISFASAGTQEYIFSKWEDGNNRWYVRRDDTGRVFMFCVVGGVAKISAISAASAVSAANTEYDIAIVGNWADTIRFYVNGVESVGSAATFTNADITNTGPLRVGRTDSNYGAFTMKNLSISNRALVLDETLDIYQADTFREIDASKAVMWLPCRTTFNDGANVVTENIGTGANVTMGAGDGGTTTPTQLSPHGFDFDNANDYMDCESDNLGTGDITFGAMIKLDSWTQTLPRIFYNGKTLLIGNNTNKNLIVSSDGSTTIQSATNSISTGKWYHVAVARTSAGLASVYVNGELSGTASQNSGTPEAGTGNTLIGNDNVSRAYDGKIDQPFIFGSILTPTQIKELSNNAFANLNV
jgi:hypothetical protein